MTISRVASQASGAFADNATSVSKAYPGNVTSGNLLLLGSWKWTPAGVADAYVVGDLTKTAGTATIGTIAMDVSRNYNYTGSNYLAVAGFSVPVTGSGSCTMQIAGAVAGSYLGIGVQEVTSGNGAITLEAGVTNSAQGSSTAPDTGNVTSAGPAQSIFFAVMTTNNAGGAGAITPKAAFTQVYELEDGVNSQPGSVIDRIVGTGVTDSGSWTAASDSWAACIASYKEPAAAAADQPAADAWNWNEDPSEDWFDTDSETVDSGELAAADVWSWDESADDDWPADAVLPADVAAPVDQPPIDVWPWDEFAEDDWQPDASLVADVAAQVDQPTGDPWNWDEDAGEDSFDADSETVDSGELAAADAWHWDDDAADEPWIDDSAPVDSGDMPAPDLWDWAEDAPEEFWIDWITPVDNNPERAYEDAWDWDDATADEPWIDDSEPVDSGDMPAPAEWADADEEADDWWHALDAAPPIVIADQPSIDEWNWDESADDDWPADAVLVADVAAAPSQPPADDWLWDEVLDDEWPGDIAPVADAAFGPPSRVRAAPQHENTQRPAAQYARRPTHTEGRRK